MVFAEDIRRIILKFADENGSKSFHVSEVARTVDPHNWRDLIEQVKFVADILVKEGKIVNESKDAFPDNEDLFFLKKKN